jgi:hypothetical protein
VVLTIAEVAADAAATSAAMQPPSRKKQQEAPAIHNSTTQKTPTRKTQRLTHTKPNQQNLKPKPHSPPPAPHPPKNNHLILPCSCNWTVNQKLSLTHTHTQKQITTTEAITQTTSKQIANAQKRKGKTQKRVCERELVAASWWFTVAVSAVISGSDDSD